MRELMAYTTAGERIPMPLRLRVRRDQVRGTGQAISAVDRLFENSGGRALAVGTPIQRFWRDAHAGRVHAINDPERALSCSAAASSACRSPTRCSVRHRDDDRDS